MTTNEADKIIEKNLNELGEHFDAVCVMVTYKENGVTRACYRGSGNYYARLGMAHEFIDNDRNSDLARRLGEELKGQ